ANMGGWELDLLESVYLDVPVIAEFLKEHNVRVRKNHFFPLLFEHVLEAFLEKHPDACETGEVNMAIAFPGGSGFDKDGIAGHLQNLYKHILGRKNNTLKGDIFVCGYKSLTTSGGFLSYQGRRIHILVEMLNGLVPIMFMEVVKKGNLMLYNGPVTRIISNKLNLALLSEHQDSDIFSLEEREVIKKYIPWTRKVVPGLEDFLLSDREHLVLKSAEGLGGKEVFPGYSTPPEEWKQRVEKALRAQNWVVQEYVPTVSYLYQDGETGCTGHHAIWGIFVFGSRCAGGFVRMMPEKNSRGVINSRQGAEESIIIEVDES
ncbi:MAG: hypothetical protein GY950_23980, partial [bacterium]|nr:hypothetical protein [bacterium]